MILELSLSRSRWPRGITHGFTAVGLLGLRVRIPSGGMDMSRVNVVCYDERVAATDLFLVTECDQVQLSFTPTMKQAEEVSLGKKEGKKERNYVR